MFCSLDSCAGPIAAAVVIPVIFIVLIIVAVLITIVVAHKIIRKGELCLKNVLIMIRVYIINLSKL
jgi:hypothetical protein